MSGTNGKADDDDPVDTTDVEMQPNPVSDFPLKDDVGVSVTTVKTGDVKSDYDEPSGLATDNNSSIEMKLKKEYRGDETLKERMARHNENRALAISCLVAVVLLLMSIALWLLTPWPSLPDPGKRLTLAVGTFGSPKRLKRHGMWLRRP